MTINLNLPEDVQRYVEAEAAIHQRSLEEEVLALLATLTEIEKKKGDEAWQRISLRRERLLAERGGIPFPDSTDIIRHSREHDH